VHRGLKELVKWVEAHRDELELNPPASSSDIATLEQMLGGPLPTDLKEIYKRFNGGKLPVGHLLPAGNEPGTIGATVREYAEAVGGDFLDPELLLPFHRTLEGSLLAFDRSAGPVSDTWSIVDYYEDTGDHRLMYRTFDGWCRHCVLEFTSDDFGEDFDLDTYLRSGQRHVQVEPDVATAHATVAHALKRSGRPSEAMESYLHAARCVPPLEWCDWEALKIAALLGDLRAGFEAAHRLSARGPDRRWAARETTPGRVAEVIGYLARSDPEPAPWLRLFEQLQEQADAAEAVLIQQIAAAVEEKEALPEPRPLRDEPMVPAQEDMDAWVKAAEEAYAQGYCRDEDLLFDPGLRRLGRVRDLSHLLETRREF
jgi:hypothetical protein